MQDQNQIEFAQFKAQWIKELFPKLNQKEITIADIGCGDGIMTYYLQEVFYEARVVGIDKQEVVEKTRESFPEICFTSWMLDTSTWPAASLSMTEEDRRSIVPHPAHPERPSEAWGVEGPQFDLIIFSLMLHHMQSDEQIACIQYWRQFLQPGGKMIILEFNPWAPAYWMRKISSLCEGAISWVWPNKILKQNYKSYYALFFPKFLGILVTLEKYIQKIPFGRLGLYVF